MCKKVPATKAIAGPDNIPEKYIIVYEQGLGHLELQDQQDILMPTGEMETIPE